MLLAKTKTNNMNGRGVGERPRPRPRVSAVGSSVGSTHATYRVLKPRMARGGFGSINLVMEEDGRAGSNGDNARLLVQKVVANSSLRVRGEILALSRMQVSDGVIKMVDAYSDGSSTYIVMEHGGQRVVSCGEEDGISRYEEDEARCIVSETLRVLAQGHAQGVLHMDVKAPNLLRRPRECANGSELKLSVIDWGLSQFVPRLQQEECRGGWGHRSDGEDEGCGGEEETSGTRTNIEDWLDAPLIGQLHQRAGTPSHMAPELMRGEPCDRSDVWSVGVMTYQMLLGELPFRDKLSARAPSLYGIWRSIMFDEPPLETQPRRHGISACALDFLRATLVKRPEKRPSALSLLRHPWLHQPQRPSQPRGCCGCSGACGSHDGCGAAAVAGYRRWCGKVVAECHERVNMPACDPCDRRTQPAVLRRDEILCRRITRLFEALDRDHDRLLRPADLLAVLPATTPWWEAAGELSRVRWMFGGKGSINQMQFRNMLLKPPAATDIDASVFARAC